MQRIRGQGSTSWFNKIVYQLEMSAVIDTRDMTVFLPIDRAYDSLPHGKKFRLNFYLNRLYYVCLQHFSIDRVYSTSSLRDGLIIPAGIGNHFFINVRENGGVSHDIFYNTYCIFSAARKVAALCSTNDL